MKKEIREIEKKISKIRKLIYEEDTTYWVVNSLGDCQSKVFFKNKEYWKESYSLINNMPLLQKISEEDYYKYIKSIHYNLLPRVRKVIEKEVIKKLVDEQMKEFE